MEVHWIRCSTQLPRDTRDKWIYLPDSPSPFQVGYYTASYGWYVEGIGHLEHFNTALPTHWAEPVKPEDRDG
jgi:hypothetical protein